ncbi:MAG: hypothetical protein Q8L48_12630 [Archangium sp.]|nr:hypothetical protein [Archangium sp.]
MAQWRIEATRQDSRCVGCGGRIVRGAWRFGTPTKTRWFHLECAAEGAPVVFPPFAAQAASLLKKAKPVGAREAPRADLVRALATPGDDALPVLADLLQSCGDPWGELIALRLQGEDELAAEHLRKHQVSLYGELLRRDVAWRNGVIVSAWFNGKPAALSKGLDRLAATRTAGRLEDLKLEGPTIDAEVLRKVSAAAPNLQRLELSGAVAGLEALELPALHTLRLKVPFGASLRLRAGPHAEVDGLWVAKLPSLRALRLTTHLPLTIAFLDRLLASSLLKQLEWLDFEDESNLMRTLDDAGLRYLLAGKKQLQHVKAMWVERSGRALAPKELAAAHAFFEARGKRAIKLARPREEAFDEVD